MKDVNFGSCECLCRQIALAYVTRFGTHSTHPCIESSLSIVPTEKKRNNFLDSFFVAEQITRLIVLDGGAAGTKEFDASLTQMK